MEVKSDKPIGIFDSGIGGLTVASAIHEAMPNEDIVYFGDTAHLPYGEKSTAAIQAYTVKICDLLIQHNCKAIMIACNSASAAAYELAKEYTASKALVFNVIDPVVEYVAKNYEAKKVGLIGTRATVNSNVYADKLAEESPKTSLTSLATPLLASMIEEGFYNNEISGVVIHQYLSNPTLAGCEAMILGCTHYPLIHDDVASFYQGATDVIDGSRISANFLKEALAQRGIDAGKQRKGKLKFFVSDFTKSFEASAEKFFGSKLHLELYRLWE